MAFFRNRSSKDNNDAVNPLDSQNSIANPLQHPSPRHEGGTPRPAPTPRTPSNRRKGEDENRPAHSPVSVARANSTSSVRNLFRQSIRKEDEGQNDVGGKQNTSEESTLRSQLRSRSFRVGRSPGRVPSDNGRASLDEANDMPTVYNDPTSPAPLEIALGAVRRFFQSRFFLAILCFLIGFSLSNSRRPVPRTLNSSPEELANIGGTPSKEAQHSIRTGSPEDRKVEQAVENLVVDRLRAIEERYERKMEILLQREATTGGFKKYPRVEKLLLSDQKRILVTGGAGFVGSHLVDRLMKDGHEVIVLDNMFTGRKRNIEQWLGHPNFELVQQDVSDGLRIEVDQIYHLASPASPPHYQFNPIRTIETNAVGTVRMLELASSVKARILLASTSEVYGDPTVHPQSEDYFGNVNTLGPRACYDEGKRVAETIMAAYAKQEGVDIRIARIFNTFGPRMHPNDGRVVSNFIIQALQQQPITIYGSGHQTRSFQFVNDLVSGLVSLMASNVTQPINLGNPDEYSMLDFATVISQLVNEMEDRTSPSETSGVQNLQFLPHTIDDPKQRQPNISRAMKFLNWQPLVPVEEGLRLTIEYFRHELAAMGEFSKVGPAE